MEWLTFFVSLFSSVGGAVGIALIALRFAKKRTETYIDNIIQHSFDKKLEEYKQKLNKQFSSYENYSKKYSDCVGNLVNQLILIEKHLKIIQEAINKCLDESSTLDYIFNQQENSNSLIIFNDTIDELIQIKVSCYIFLPNNLIDDIEDIMNKIEAYIAGIKREMEEVQINRRMCVQLLDSGNSIHSIVELLLKHIRQENLRQAGEL